MQSGQVPISSGGAQARFKRLLFEYLEVRQGNASDFVLRKAGSCAYSFYEMTITAAPSAQEIKEKVISLGWQVKRKKGRWKHKDGEKRGDPGPLNRMRASVIGRRIKARYAVASGFIPAIAELRPDNKLKSRGTGVKDGQQIRAKRGYVKIFFDGKGDISVCVANTTPGIGRVNDRHHIITRGFNQESRDIISYLRTKDAGLSGKLVGGTQAKKVKSS